MQNLNRLPRWFVENDPSWERSVDSNLGMLKWTKKGTGIEAVCSPTGMFCEINGLDAAKDGSEVGIKDLQSMVTKFNKPDALSGTGDISKYLSSRHVNPSINGPPRFTIGLGFGPNVSNNPQRLRKI